MSCRRSSLLLRFWPLVCSPWLRVRPSRPQNQLIRKLPISSTLRTFSISSAAKQALQKSKNDGVRAFAQQMVGDHTTVNNQALALVKKLNVKPEDNPTSQSLKKEANATRNKLASLN